LYHAVVKEIVGHLLEERVGVEVKAGLRAVPSRVAKPAAALTSELHALDLPAQAEPSAALLDPLERRFDALLELARVPPTKKATRRVGVGLPNRDGG
jgi:hypothetical protein